MYNNEIKNQKKIFKSLLRRDKNKERKKYFLGKTFSAKLFIKLCSKVVDTSIMCLEILNFQKENRTKDEIEAVLPWMKNLSYFYEFISIKETEETRKELLRHFIWFLFRKIYYKNTIIKKIDNNNRLLCLVLEGFLIKLDLVFYREVLSLDEYLKYLIKMEIMEEKDIISKCRILNKSFIDMNTDSIKEFCLKHNDIYNYASMKSQAMNELIFYGITIPIKEIPITEIQDYKYTSIDNYLKIFLFKSNPKTSHDKSKAYFKFYIGKYVRNGIIKKGQYIGTFLKNEIKDSSRYISKDKCIVGLIDKEKYYSDKLYKAYKEKMIKIFSEYKKHFAVFHNLKDEIYYQNYVPYMHYKKYNKGEKIFIQNSIYEGIYFLTEGTIKLSIYASINEIQSLMTYLTFSLNNFNEYVSGFNIEKLVKQNIKNDLINDKGIMSLYSKKDIYDLMTIKEYNIFGTNEAFDPKTKLFNFTAECISDSAVVYFFPRLYLNFLLNKEKSVYNSFIQLVEFRIKNLIGRMKKYIKEFEREIKYQKSHFNNKTECNILQNNNIKNKIIFRNERNNLDKNIFLATQKNLFNNPKINRNFGIKIKNIKKSLNETEKNKEGFLTTRNAKFNYRNNNNVNIPKIYTISRNKRKEYNISSSQAKNRNIKYFPDIFPYIVIDSLNKKSFFKDVNNNNYIKDIKTINNFSGLKLRKLVLKKIQG